MNKADIIDAWVKIRKIDNTIPDEVLDLMKNAAIEKLAQSLKGEGEWISVKDRLPDKEGYYLVYPYKCGFSSYYHKYGKWAGKWTTDDINGYEGENYTVTHWKISAPPNE